MVRCIKCKKDKSKLEFYPSSLKIYSYICKECSVKKQRKYHWENRDERKKYAKKYYKENREKLLKQDIKRKNILKEMHIKIFGNNCVICNKIERRMPLHEIRGKKHPNNLYIYLKNPENFRRLCYHCHRAVHKLMKFNKTWIQILDFINIKDQMPDMSDMERMTG